MTALKNIRDSAARWAIFGVFAAIFMSGITYALTFSWSDPSALREKSSGSQLQSSQWNLLVGNVDNLNERLSNAETQGGIVPTGTVIAYNGTSCPTGWTEAAGSAVPTGIGGSSSLDLRWEFIRGWDHSKGTDVSRTFASWQAPSLISTSIGPDAMQQPIIEGSSANTASDNDFSSGMQTDFIQDSWYWSAFKGYAFVLSTYGYPGNSAWRTVDGNSVRPANGTSFYKSGWARPRNIALLHCVKN